MKVELFLSALLLVAYGVVNCGGASIGDSQPAEQVPDAAVPCEGEACDGEPVPAKLEETVDVVESASGAQKEELRREEEEEAPEVVEAELERQELPYEDSEVKTPQDVDTSDVIDVKSASQAQRVADESLLKALDTVISEDKTLDDVLRTEDAGVLASAAED